MNEPDAGVGLAILAVVLAVPVLLALLIPLAARRGAQTAWLVWGIGFLLFVAIAGPLAATFSVNSEDKVMFTGLIIGTGVATASSAWVVNRTLRADPRSSFSRLAGHSILTSLVVMVLVLRASC